jgi:RPA family protein
METDQFKREIAIKTKISTLLTGKFVKQPDMQPSYIQDEYGRNISRVNLIATIVSEPEDVGPSSVIMVDDSSGQIQVRTFDNTITLDNLEVGNIIVLIGKIREYNQEKYIIPEIIKIVEDQKWVTIREKEIEFLEKNLEKQPIEESKDTEETTIEKNQETEDLEEIIESSPTEDIYNLIKKIDNGQGALIDDIIAESGKKNTEQIIDNLLKEGEVFEISPGRIKVLE